jgi:peroxiredoxin
LRRWEELLREELDARGVEIVTVSPEAAAKVRSGRGKHGLRARMLADPELRVIDRLGLRNLGVHSGPPGLKGLPVPTTILVDAQGIVRWIDQAENYQVRSNPSRVLGALRSHLGQSEHPES